MIVQIKKILFLSSIGCFFLSLLLPCFYLKEGAVYGYDALFNGWIGVIAGGAFLCWLANPLLFGAWYYFFRNYTMALLSSGLSLLFSFGFLFYDQIQTSESGQHSAIFSLGPGYWFWLLSTVILFFGNLWLRVRSMPMQI